MCDLYPGMLRKSTDAETFLRIVGERYARIWRASTIMNRTDRLLAILLELQARRWQRAEDLAATFEVSKRTIYRDMLALAESGVPLVSIAGQGYSLVEGYFLPPLSFTTDEAIMLLLGTDFVGRNVDAQYQAAAHTATSKIEAVLSPTLRSEVAYLQRSIQFVALNSQTRPEVLATVRRAIIQRRRVRFEYRARFPNEGEDTPLIREVDPYGLIHFNGTWFLAGYDYLREDRRHFRLDRILGDVTVLPYSFERPPDFRVGVRPQEEEREIEVRLLFDSETARWVREIPSFFQVAAEDYPDGLLVTLKIKRYEEILQWTLGWGSHVQVLEPDDLREHLAAECRAMLENYQPESLLT